MTGGGVSKGGQIRVRLDAAPDAGQGFEKPDEWPPYIYHVHFLAH